MNTLKFLTYLYTLQSILNTLSLFCHAFFSLLYVYIHTSYIFTCYKFTPFNTRPTILEHTLHIYEQKLSIHTIGKRVSFFQK